MRITLQVVNITSGSLVKRYALWGHMPQRDMILSIDGFDYRVVRITVSGEELESMYAYVEPLHE